MFSVLATICLSASNCQSGELLREIRTEQRKLPHVTQNQVMQNVFRNYDNLNKEVKDTLDTIWNNDAGNLLLRRLYKVIKNDKQRLTILWDTCDKEGNSNLFCHDMTVYLDTRKFGQCIGYRNGELCTLPETLDDVLFHEMMHGLHKLTGENDTDGYDVINHLHKFPNNMTIFNECCKVWTNNEEVHTITGLYLGVDGKLHFDCLNTNSYMVLKALKNGTPINRIIQRVFHCDYTGLQDISKSCRNKIKNIVIPQKKYLDIKI